MVLLDAIRHGMHPKEAGVIVLVAMMFVGLSPRRTNAAAPQVTRAEAKLPPLKLKLRFLYLKYDTFLSEPRAVPYGSANPAFIFEAKWSSPLTSKDKVRYRIWIRSDQTDWASADEGRATDPLGKIGWIQNVPTSPERAYRTKSALIRMDLGYRPAGWRGVGAAQDKPLPSLLPVKPGKYHFELCVRRWVNDNPPQTATSDFTVEVSGDASKPIVAGLADNQVIQRTGKTKSDLPVTVIAPSAGQPIQVSVSMAGKVIGKTEETSVQGAQTVAVSNVPVGGPYTVDVNVGHTKHHFKDVYVGDLWIVSGQSNAVGAGHDMSLARKPMPGVEELDPKRMRWNWRPAADGFFESTVGAWVAAAQDYYRQTHVPVGLMGQAEGSRVMAYFLNVKTGEMRFLQRLVQAHGQHARAFFWYQGESDTFHQDMVDAYGKRLRIMTADLRRYTHNPNLIVGIVQLARYGWYHDDHFARMREIQRQYVLSDPNSVLYATIPYTINHKDRIHLLSKGYMGLAKQITGQMVHWEKTGEVQSPGPMVTSAKFAGPARQRIIVTFSNADGLTGGSAINQWYVTDQTHQGFHHGGFVDLKTVKVDPDRGQVALTLAAPPLGNAAVSYGYRCDIGGDLANQAGFPAPAFVKVKVNRP